MKRIWAPWRVQYIRAKNATGCIFCDELKEDKDEENFVLYRGNLNFVMMNLFPYNPGHLLIVPYRHIGQLEDMTPEERNDHYETVTRSVAVLRRVTGTDNYNLGMNLGRVAGAGIADHIHTHIVPRWNGDNNFMAVIGETRVISESMSDVYKRLKAGFQK